MYYSYTIVTDRRDELQEYLSSKGVETKVQHPILMPFHKAYCDKFKCNVPVAEKLVKQILCLPNQEDLSQEEVEHVIDSVKGFFKGA